MSTLEFTLSIIDKVTKPLKPIEHTVDQLAQNFEKSFQDIVESGSSLSNTVFELKNTLEPALAVQNVLEMATLSGVDDDAMNKITQDALNFSAQYGISSADFVQSSLAIRQSISGLSDNALPELTTITNTTALALKSTTSETSAYMGKMFSQFQGYADDIGQVKFAEQLSNKAIVMSKAFGTSMTDIAQLMERGGAVSAKFGVGIDEQLAVLGQLQTSLGSESSSAYESFLSVASGGAEKLGLSFVNASGQMMTMPEMLEKLQSKYGQSIEGNLKAQQEIEEAFGSSATVIYSLFNNVDSLRKNISALGADDGMQRATNMAKMYADPWARLLSIWDSIKVSVGMTLLPVVIPLVNQLANMGQQLIILLTTFPNIATAIGYVVGGLSLFAFIGGVANTIMAISRNIIAGYNIVLFLCNLRLKENIIFTSIAKIACIAWNATLLILSNTLKVVRIGAMLAGVAFNFMSWPLLIIIAVIGLVVFAVYQLIKHWDEIKAAIAQTAVFKSIVGIFDNISATWSEVTTVVKSAWDSVCNFFANLSPIDIFNSYWSTVSKLADDLFSGISKGWDAVLNWFKDFSPIAIFNRYWSTISALTDTLFSGISNGWSAVCNWFMNLSPVQTFMNFCSSISDLFGELWNWVSEGWDNLCKWFEDFSIADTFSGISDSIKGIFDGLWNWLNESFNSVFNSIASNLNYLPGVNIDLRETKTIETNSALHQAPTQADYNAQLDKLNRFFGINVDVQKIEGISPQVSSLKLGMQSKKASDINYQKSLLTGNDLKGINQGGLSQETNSNTHIDKRQQYGNITINNAGVMQPKDMTEWLALNNLG